ncbi:glycosyltransferase [uncultured Bacteroides sp.]|uniref:glycosyltransferase n=1 Tax=uncultured Bacteroides sp. TaxID=162156 RepID=UPI0025E30FDF|nr:glycosyltransferase [uncultured Bacteroides sp.]
MNLLFITKLYPAPPLGGIERVTYILTRELAKRGWGIYNLYFDRSDYDGGYGWIDAACMDGTWNADRLSSFLVEKHIRCIINQSHFYYTPTLREAIGNKPIKLITAFHNAPYFKAQGVKNAMANSHSRLKRLIPLLYLFYKIISERRLRNVHRTSYELSDMTVLLSPSYLPIYQNALGIDGAKLISIYNPLSYEENIKEAEMEKKEDICLVVARLYEQQKRISIILKAWEKLQVHKDWRLVIVGDGEDKTVYEQYVLDNSLQGVTFVGRKDSLLYYKQAKIFLMTSVVEGWPMTIVESMQNGVVPVVMASFAAVHDLIEDGRNGYLTKFRDIDAFTAKVKVLIDNELLRKRMAIEGLEKVKAFTTDKIMECWEKWIKY